VEADFRERRALLFEIDHVFCDWAIPPNRSVIWSAPRKVEVGFRERRALLFEIDRAFCDWAIPPNRSVIQQAASGFL